ncbi:hypothetical protein [Bacillus mycoides]|uniref:hypothetical protein n=1 Tax=Bacillus mycoides TaxID=1405 RepID=UPI000A27ABAA|nr:hypothetical protein [Bacillus mycoides]OSY03791.1 hypothetical protein BTJ44_05115 [Bacillus mycoides]
MQFYKGKIENRLFVIEDENSIDYWEISIAETYRKNMDMVFRYAKAINQQTGKIIDWDSYLEQSNDAVFETITKKISKDISVW